MKNEFFKDALYLIDSANQINQMIDLYTANNRPDAVRILIHTHFNKLAADYESFMQAYDPRYNKYVSVALPDNYKTAYNTLDNILSLLAHFVALYGSRVYKIGQVSKQLFESLRNDLKASFLFFDFEKLTHLHDAVVLIEILKQNKELSFSAFFEEIEK